MQMTARRVLRRFAKRKSKKNSKPGEEPNQATSPTDSANSSRTAEDISKCTLAAATTAADQARCDQAQRVIASQFRGNAAREEVHELQRQNAWSTYIRTLCLVCKPRAHSSHQPTLHTCATETVWRWRGFEHESKGEDEFGALSPMRGSRSFSGDGPSRVGPAGPSRSADLRRRRGSALAIEHRDSSQSDTCDSSSESPVGRLSSTCSRSRPSSRRPQPAHEGAPSLLELISLCVPCVPKESADTLRQHRCGPLWRCLEKM